MKMYDLSIGDTVVNLPFTVGGDTYDGKWIYGFRVV